ncbi:MAG: SUMF1/EgtB/PvdO family nonheme iron enzyme [Desulfobacterales bacterium]|nr:SUMF1/EgtB/PvdO family nonheme iron enzyme [Desulfobacterales bacterium]
MNILHLSDLHFGSIEDAQKWHSQLADDLINEIGCNKLDVLVLSGDIANMSVPEEYKAAKQFIDDLCKEFSLKPDQVVIAPGNHDLNWKTAKKGYNLYDREDYEEELKDDCYIEVGDDVIRVRDEEKYKDRFENFSRFYQDVKGRPYPLEYGKQGILNHFPELDLLFLELNSAWNLDCFFTSRAGIQPAAVSYVLGEIRRNSEIYEGCFKFAVWHHPLSSPFDDRITDRGFMQRLSQAGFCLALHGHIHKAEASLFCYDHSADGRKIHMVCAGTFGAPVRDWYPGYPLQYNLLKLEGSKLTVETRCRRELNGAWGPDAMWTQGAGRDPLPRYEIILPSIEITRNRQHIPVEGDHTIPAEIPAIYRKWLIERCRHMDIDKLRERGRVIQVNLPEIFIPLYASYREDIEELISKYPYLLIEGQAGSGKTTLMKHFSYATVNDKKDCLPILIFLKDLKGFEPGKEKMVASAEVAENILSHYFSVTGNGLDVETVKDFCRSGKGVFLFDGLDEIDLGLRNLIAGSFADFRIQNPGVGIFFSGRPHGVDGTVVDRFGDRHVKILPLNISQVEDFIRKWFCFIFETGDCGVGNKTAVEMIAEIEAHPAIGRLIDTPLMLTAICLLYHDGKELPGQRAELYKKFVDNLMFRRFDDPEKVHRFLMSLALVMHNQGVRGIDRGHAVDVLGGVYARNENEADRDYFERLENEFDRIEPNCGLLKFENGQYIFWHLTFQEFLTATAFVDRERRDYSRAIAEFWDNDWYSEVIELYIGYLSIQNMGMANEIVRKALEKADLKPFRRWRLAACALLDIHEDRRILSVTDVTKKCLLLITDSEAEPKDRADTGEILGRLGDPRNLKEFILVEGGKYSLSLGEIEIEPFEISKYPVTNGWFAEFVNAGGYENPEYWSEEGWEWLKKSNHQVPEDWYDREWNCPNAPVVGVFWYEADAFARWMTLTGDGGFVCSLPDENQWEAAAAGFEKREYPWGQWKEDCCNSREAEIKKTCSVGIFKKGDTPSGISDMTGNVWEWTCSEVDSFRVLRGGAWVSVARFCRTAARSRDDPRGGGRHYGFRLVVLPGQQVTGK